MLIWFCDGIKIWILSLLRVLKKGDRYSNDDITVDKDLQPEWADI